MKTKNLTWTWKSKNFPFWINFWTVLASFTSPLAPVDYWYSLRNFVSQKPEPY